MKDGGKIDRGVLRLVLFLVEDFLDLKTETDLFYYYYYSSPASFKLRELK